MKLMIGLLLVLLLVPGTDAVYGQTPRQKSTTKAATYECPMHPEVSSSKRGRCPKCGMDLRQVKQKAGSVANGPEQDSSFSSLKIPDEQVYNQNGEQLNFYTDLIKGKTVAINFVFTTCTAVCPSLTATFRRVQQEAEKRGVDVQLISISVDPTVDTPERLREFAAKYKAGPGWTFVTGEKTRIDSVLQSLGVAAANKNDHTPMVLIGSDVTDDWSRVYGLSSPTKIVDLLSAAN